MRERDIEAYLKKRIEVAGGLCLKFTSSEAGVPDRVVIYKGDVWFVEVKNDSGFMSAIQVYQRDRLTKAGAQTAVVWSKTDVDLFMDCLIA